MDSSNNLVPGIDPAALEAAAAAEANNSNPAADVANAALAGAEPVVKTTDLNAADVAPEPTLQPAGLTPTEPSITAPVEAPVEAPAETPADDGPVTLAPSADFQMGEVSTVSAAPNEEVMIGAPLEESTPENPLEGQNGDQLANTGATENSEPSDANDFNNPEDLAAAEAKAEKKDKDEEDAEPLVAAAPVPGSIGSAKSYADIQRAEAEKAARVAARQKQKIKLSKNTIIIIAIAVVAIIGIAVGAIMIVGGNSTPTPAPVSSTEYDDEEEHDLSTLSCKRQLAPEEYSSYGAIAGTYENIFYFKDDTLDGLVTNFAYSYENKQLAEFYRDKFKLDYGAEEQTSKKADSESEAESEVEEEPAVKKTTAEMLHHYVTMSNLTVTHGMEIKSEDIEAWLASDAYSDKTYGAPDDGVLPTNTPTNTTTDTTTGTTTDGTSADVEEEIDTTESGEVIRNLKFYNRLQNSIDFTCSISKGY